MAGPKKVCVFCLELLTGTQSQSVSKYLSQYGRTSVVNIGELLGIPPMNSSEKGRIGMCNSCLERIDHLSPLVQKVRNLLLQINDVLHGIYRDLENDPFTMAVEQDFLPFVEYRNKAAKNPHQYVFELQSVRSSAREAATVDDRLPEVEAATVDERVPQVEIQPWIESDNAFLCENKGDSDMDLDVDPMDSLEVPENEEVNMFACTHEDASKETKCDLIFKNKEHFDAHQASHTLRVRLYDDVTGYFRTRLRKYWRNHARQLIKADLLFRCVHIDCSEYNRMRKEEFQEHLKQQHSLYACPNLCSEAGKFLRSCLDLYDSAQELDEHVSSHRQKKKKKAKLDEHVSSHKPKKKAKLDDMDFQTPNEITAVATMYQNIVRCSGCPGSSKRFFFNWEFGGHVVRHHKFFMCLHEEGSGICHYSVQSKDALMEHYAKQHGHQQIATENSTEKTMLFLDPESPYTQCYVCGQLDLNSTESFTKHMKEQHNILVCGLAKQWEADVVTKFCHGVSHSEPLLKVHRASCNLGYKASREHRYKAICRLCGRELVFVDRESWIQHVREDHNAYLCNIRKGESETYCGTMTLSKTVMKKHVEAKHDVEIALGTAGNSDSALQLYSEGSLDEIPGLPLDGPAVCQTCSISFEKFDQEWAKHIRSHGWVVCDVMCKESSRPCLLIFFSVEQLRNHINSVHTESGNPYLRCNQCKLEFSNMFLLMAHMSRKHLGNATKICPNCGRTRFLRTSCVCTKNFGCDLCEKKFISPFELKLHKSIAHEGLKFPCNSCDKSFRSKSTLRQHVQKIHKVVLGDGIFPCSECDKTFFTQGEKDQHHKRAHGERKFKCDRCEWSFKRPQNLARHKETVHDQLRPFICYICGGTFKSSSHMQAHIRKHDTGQMMKQLKSRDRKLKTPPPPTEASANSIIASEQNPSLDLI